MLPPILWIRQRSLPISELALQRVVAGRGGLERGVLHRQLLLCRLPAAAERLHITQPSVSHGLARLRDLLDEPLFTRHRDGMAPTFFATQLYDQFRHALSDIETAIESARNFDPASSETSCSAA